MLPIDSHNRTCIFSTVNYTSTMGTFRNFFSKFCLWVFWQLDLASCWRLTSVAKNACFAQWGQFLKSFLVYPRTFCNYSLTFLSETSQTHHVTHFKLHCWFLSTQNLLLTGMGFSFSTSVLLDFVFFPLEYSHLCMFLRWVFVSAVAFWPCLASGSYWFSLNLIWKFKNVYKNTFERLDPQITT